MVSGKVEIFFGVSDGDLVVDTLQESGCVMNQVSIISLQKITYSARAVTDCEMLTISKKDLMTMKDKNSMITLNAAIEEFEQKYIKARKLNEKREQMHFLDY